MVSDQDETFGQWRRALLDALSSRSKVAAWQDRRYRFAHQVGQLLVGTLFDGRNPVIGHVVYGVYVEGGGLVYVGQSTEAERRLRDLPVGESHHIVTTVPPEIWERVIVVQWPSLLDQIAADESDTAEQLGLDTCGLAIEHLLQVTYRPLLSERRRDATGVWSTRNIVSSRSRGAVASRQLSGLFGQVQMQWDALAEAKWSGSGDPIIYSEAGRAVFPGALLLRPSRAADRSFATRRGFSDSDLATWH